MNYEIGKIVKYENKESIIINESGEKYLFLESDLKTTINKDNLVIFRREVVNDRNRAFFVRDLNIFLNNEKNKNNLKKYYKKNNN